MKMYIKKACIRGCEEKTSSKGNNYLLVRYEDETGEAGRIMDGDLSRKPLYIRDAILTLVVNYKSGVTKSGVPYSNMQVTGVERCDV